MNDTRWLIALNLSKTALKARMPEETEKEYKAWFKNYNTTHHEDPCNYIDWFVDILGTMDLLAMVVNAPVEDISERGSEARRAFSAGRAKDGLYFKDGHWYAVKDNKKMDSYSSAYQITGTAHFCQTFACLLYLGQTNELERRNWAHNIKIAVSFIQDLFKNTQYYRFLINEIKTSDYADRTIHLPNKKVQLSKITKKDLMTYTDVIIANAASLQNCREG